MGKVSASMLAVALYCASVLPLGCGRAVKTDTRPAEGDRLRHECERLLWTLQDCGTEGSMLEVMGRFDLLMSKNGREALADALKSIARQDRHLRSGACSVLSRYVSVEEHAGFILDLKKEEAR